MASSKTTSLKEHQSMESRVILRGVSRFLGLNGERFSSVLGGKVTVHPEFVNNPKNKSIEELKKEVGQWRPWSRIGPEFAEKRFYTTGIRSEHNIDEYESVNVLFFVLILFNIRVEDLECDHCIGLANTSDLNQANPEKNVKYNLIKIILSGVSAYSEYTHASPPDYLAFNFKDLEKTNASQNLVFKTFCFSEKRFRKFIFDSVTQDGIHKFDLISLKDFIESIQSVMLSTFSLSARDMGEDGKAFTASFTDSICQRVPIIAFKLGLINDLSKQTLDFLLPPRPEVLTFENQNRGCQGKDLV